MTAEEEAPELEREVRERQKLLARPSRARYNKVHAALDRRWRRRRLETDRMLREVIDELWDVFAGSPYSWCGFYVLAPSEKELVLGPHRDKPAKTPLALHGVCGKVLTTGLPVVVPDVKALGKGHIACDPKAASEIAVPVLDPHGKVWAVLDVDSETPSAFDEMDQRWLERILKRFQEVERS